MIHHNKVVVRKECLNRNQVVLKIEMNSKRVIVHHNKVVAKKNHLNHKIIIQNKIKVRQSNQVVQKIVKNNK